MKGFFLILLSIFTGLMLFIAAGASAQKHAPDDGWGRWTGLYNPGTEKRISGEVTAVERNPDTRDRSYGVQLRVRTDAGDEVVLHLGPAWFVHNQDFDFKVGDRVEALGSFVEISGTRIMVARELTKDGKLLKLRNEKGFPYWVFRLDP